MLQREPHAYTATACAPVAATLSIISVMLKMVKYGVLGAKLDIYFPKYRLYQFGEPANNKSLAVTYNSVKLCLTSHHISTYECTVMVMNVYRFVFSAHTPLCQSVPTTLTTLQCVSLAPYLGESL